MRLFGRALLLKGNDRQGALIAGTPNHHESAQIVFDRIADRGSQLTYITRMDGNEFVILQDQLARLVQLRNSRPVGKDHLSPGIQNQHAVVDLIEYSGRPGWRGLIET